MNDLVLNFELEALRYFGEGTALAFIRINDKKRPFTIEGVNSLLKNHTSEQEQSQLLAIKKKMLSTVNLKDIGEDDFSGQTSIF